MEKVLSRLLAILLLAAVLLPAESSAPAQVAGTSLTFRAYLPVTMRLQQFDIWLIGPWMGRVLNVAQDPFNPQVAYAATFGSGVYKTWDGGKFWSPVSVGIDYLVIQSLAVDPVSPNTLYAGTYGDAAAPYNGVYKSINGGASWTRTGVMANTWDGVTYTNAVVYALAVDPMNPSRVYAGTRMRGLPSGSLGGGGVFRSENGGASWQPVNAGLPHEDLYVYDLATDPRIPGRVYAAMHQHGLYRSDNYGASWYPLYDTPWSGRAIAVDPYDSNKLYFGAMKNQGAYRSTDGGQNWSPIGGGGWDIVVGGLSPDPFHPGRIYAGVMLSENDIHLWRAENPESSWSPVANGSVWGRVAYGRDGVSALVAVEPDGPYKTTDGGDTWHPSNVGLSGFSITGLAISPQNWRVMVAGLYGRGLYATTDGGQNWSLTGSGQISPNILSVAMAPQNPAILYVATSDAGVFRSTNGGASWTQLAGGFPPAEELPAAGRTASTLPVWDPYANRLLPERDELKDDPDAEPPALDNLTMELAQTNALAVSPFDANVVLAATGGRGVRSLNGTSWVSSDFVSGNAYTLVFDRSRAGRVLVGSAAAYGGVLVSANNGMNWTLSHAGIAGRAVYSLAQHPTDAAIFLAGTDSGVYVSRDGGNTWTLAGLQGQAVKSVGMRPEGWYFAATASAAYFSDAQLASWEGLGALLANTGGQGIVTAPGGPTYFLTRLSGLVAVFPK